MQQITFSARLQKLPNFPISVPTRDTGRTLSEIAELFLSVIPQPTSPRPNISTH
ncbi:MAG: hypothetical protein JWN37_103 [Candidatus Nomurabacteria bacterium]|nr:hypothetical protein [Candidatus Nomurabacteria bacterium]